MKKLLAIVLAAAMLCAAMLTMLSCGSDSTKTEETTAADTKTTLIMATNANFPPYEYKEGNGYAGIDVEIATEIAKKLGISQVQVSRLLRRTLKKIQDKIDPDGVMVRS